MKIKLTNVFYPHHCVADGRPQHELDEVQPDLADSGGELGETVFTGLVSRDCEGAGPAGVLQVSQVGGDGSSTVSGRV